MQALPTTASLLLFARIVGEHTFVRPLRSGLGALARSLGLPPPDLSGLPVRPMSAAWLRENEAECAKHDGGC